MVAKTLDRDEAFVKARIEIQENGCWNWARSITWDGYGQVTGLGENRAHRLSWKIFKGALSQFDVVCHSCDNRLCVNPEHLFTGSHSDNRRDAMAKGRIDAKAMSDHANDFLRIPQEKVDAVLQHVREKRGTYEEIARLHGIARQSVANIINRNR